MMLTPKPTFIVLVAATIFLTIVGPLPLCLFVLLTLFLLLLSLGLLLALRSLLLLLFCGLGFFLLLFRLSLLLLFLRLSFFFVLLLLRVCRNYGPKKQDQNSRANKTQRFHVCCLHHHNFRHLPLVASGVVVVPILSASPC